MQEGLDLVSERRLAMAAILGRWDLEGAMPTSFGLELVHKHVDGETDFDGAVDMLGEHNGIYARMNDFRRRQKKSAPAIAEALYMVSILSR